MDERKHKIVESMLIAAYRFGRVDALLDRGADAENSKETIESFARTIARLYEDETEDTDPR